MVDIIPKEDVAERKDIKRRFDYNAPTVKLDRDATINVKYCLLDIDEEYTGRIPRLPGAYVITTKSGYVYIGYSKNLFIRLRQHLSDSKNKSFMCSNIFEPIKRIQAYVTETPLDAKILESWLIRELRPKLNMEFIIDNQR